MRPSVPSSSGSLLNSGPHKPNHHAGFQGWFETPPESGQIVDENIVAVALSSSRSFCIEAKIGPVIHPLGFFERRRCFIGLPTATSAA
jgi:hypothetical protein